MSTKIMWLIGHKKWHQNSSLTDEIVFLMRQNNLNPKQIAKDIRIPTEKVRNWFYRSTGLSALDFILLMAKYSFIKDFVDEILLKCNLENIS
ncbi:MAG: hypothetical protein ACP59X_16485 [Solidesulfovibrio sp. DCME]|uniref:hypothetical protein n=1 Tax=Solidesulfovibrio sp. DCME TaxID=3447380 RepID=UPI003D0E6AEF